MHTKDSWIYMLKSNITHCMVLEASDERYITMSSVFVAAFLKYLKDRKKM